MNGGGRSENLGMKIKRAKDFLHSLKGFRRWTRQKTKTFVDKR
jgi:hypothetical protein